MSKLCLSCAPDANANAYVNADAKVNADAYVNADTKVNADESDSEFLVMYLIRDVPQV